MKKLMILGYALWIIGLALFITGLNLTGSTKEWMTVTGSFIFLAGLGAAGVAWAKKKKEE